VPDRYEINLAGPAIRNLSRLAPKFADAALRFIDGPLAEDPWRVTKPLLGQFAGLRSGRVGTSYRVLVRVDEGSRVVHVLAVAHRSDVFWPG
jgi:mRNA-degrading endonuclease RelE of RelBE toxin-antitoxin system